MTGKRCWRSASGEDWGPVTGDLGRGCFCTAVGTEHLTVSGSGETGRGENKRGACGPNRPRAGCAPRTRGAACGRLAGPAQPAGPAEANLSGVFAIEGKKEVEQQLYGNEASKENVFPRRELL